MKLLKCRATTIPSLCLCASIFLGSANFAVGVASADEGPDQKVAEAEAFEPSEAAAGAEKPTLVIGSQAPKLQVSDWFKGEPVEAFSDSNVYVVEVWATWCGPCIAAMPHLNELSEQYKKDGLVVVALTSADPANTKEAVEKFVAGRGAEFDFRFAFCDDQETHKSYMDASGRQSIPTSFVVDRKGKIAFVGHPNDLDYVLRRVMEGSWRGQADADELASFDVMLRKAMAGIEQSPEESLQIVTMIESRAPHYSSRPDFLQVKMTALVAGGKPDEAKTLLESVKDSLIEHKSGGILAMLGATLASKQLNPKGVHREFGLEVLGLGLEANQEDLNTIVQVAIAYQVAGEARKARETLENAMEKVEDEQSKAMLKVILQKLEQHAEGAKKESD
ncbi:TlpA disulfide reductase family protein [Blastopirellula retiformator]|uniref:Thiol-disulfide oxidoreductase ResA n=1 Tax=Blastopirellula retiformator TaxID=2527970 RepID=A0A5C5V0T1_9BACT|nr:TlpA disulfide reductase family protein [Blastopirellula retiformator]TWT31563.1 Thiol-disulfide oxidoreductase ResA [Blastopirellula retiformator]